MWMKIVVCLTIIIIFNCYESSCDDLQSAKGFNISKNITIHRNGYGRVLAFLSFLKSLHRAKKLHHPLKPITVSKLWRASFEFEVKPHTFYPLSHYYYPKHGPVELTNSIESVFQFGDNPQQVSNSIGGPNKITSQPVDIDIRDEISTETNQPDKQDTVPYVLEILPKENEIKSERFLRHADITRMNEADEESENQGTTSANDDLAEDSITTQYQSVSTTTEPTNEMTETLPTTTARAHETESTIHGNNDQDLTTTSSIPTEWLGMTETLPTTTARAHETESTIHGNNDQDLTTTSSIPTEWLGMTETLTVTTAKPHGTASTIHENNDQGFTTTSSVPTEWLGYYDYGAHKPDFIEHVEFTTEFPSQMDVEQYRYVNHYPPFRPSLRDYPNSFYSRFFVPMKYFKR